MALVCRGIQPLALLAQPSDLCGRLFRSPCAHRPDQQIARGHGFGAEGAHLHPVALLLEEEGAIEQQPDFQGAAKQVAHQLHAGDIAKTPLSLRQQGGVVEPRGQAHPLALGGPVAEILEVPGQQALLQVGHRQVLIHSAHLALQAVKGEAPHHLPLPQPGDAGTAGHHLLQRQLQIALAKAQGTGPGGPGEGRIVLSPDKVVATRGEGHPLGTPLGHPRQQMGVQIAAGMERHGVMVRGDEGPGLGGKGIRLHEPHVGAVARGEPPPLLAERPLPLQAQDLGATVQRHQAPQMPLAGAPLQIGTLVGGRQPVKASICPCLRPGMYIAMALAHWTGSGAKGASSPRACNSAPAGIQGASRVQSASMSPSRCAISSRVRAARHFARAGASRAKAIPKW